MQYNTIQHHVAAGYVAMLFNIDIPEINLPNKNKLENVAIKMYCHL